MKTSLRLLLDNKVKINDFKLTLTGSKCNLSKFWDKGESVLGRQLLVMKSR